MRAWVLIVGIVGGLSCAALGISWLLDASEPLAEVSTRQTTAAWVLIANAVVGLIGGVLGFRGKHLPATVVFLIGAAAPMIFVPKSVGITSILVLAAILAFVSKDLADQTVS